MFLFSSHKRLECYSLNWKLFFRFLQWKILRFVLTLQHWFSCLPVKRFLLGKNIFCLRGISPFLRVMKSPSNSLALCLLSYQVRLAEQFFFSISKLDIISIPSSDSTFYELSVIHTYLWDLPVKSLYISTDSKIHMPQKLLFHWNQGGCIDYMKLLMPGMSLINGNL